MFDNSIPLLFGTTAVPVTHSVNVIDTDNGVTKRRKALGGGEFIDLTISHSESKEKGGLVADRHLVRVDHIIPDPDPTKSPCILSHYSVTVVPRHPSSTNIKAREVMSAQLGVLSNNEWGLHQDDSALVSQTDRLFNGES